MTTELTDIDTNEVSLVTRGANRKRFTVRKEEDPMSKPTEEQKQKLMKALTSATPSQLQKALNALELKKGLSDMAEASKAKVIQAIKLLASIGSDLPEGLMDDLITSLGVESTSDLLAAMEGAGPAAADEGTVDDTTAEEGDATMSKETTAATVQKAELNDAAKAQIEKAEKAAATANTELASLKKQAETDAKARVDLEKQVKVERDARITKEFIAKAEVFKHLGTPASELGPVLKALHEASPDQAAKLEKMLEVANTKAATQEKLLKELGHNQAPAGGETSAYSELQKKAAEIRKTEPKLTDAQAFTKALELHPALYEQYETERLER